MLESARRLGRAGSAPAARPSRVVCARRLVGVGVVHDLHLPLPRSPSKAPVPLTIVHAPPESGPAAFPAPRSQLLSIDVHVKAVSERLGHSFDELHDGHLPARDPVDETGRRDAADQLSRRGKGKVMGKERCAVCRRKIRRPDSDESTYWFGPAGDDVMAKLLVAHKACYGTSRRTSRLPTREEGAAAREHDGSGPHGEERGQHGRAEDRCVRHGRRGDAKEI